ncbi:hypothetical protein [Labrys monachus]|uniref:N-methylhydantoinase B/oxoprolinase/acetone carboxylase alpha subunit n=1 Tax=Labrys monachus TaxID=217067 RepID=A0ABU0FI93_9HYPH|nr:hypothetical protein [Labrys monachus]MDQ0394332.1 N-methylhydantoinase B/oxoprolinase/acetone carboxylase alpha subunit [Labrys monachus]
MKAPMAAGRTRTGRFGNPLERDPHKVLDDVLDGFCSPEDAREIYGVVLDLESETVDLGGTQALRLQREGQLQRRPPPLSP